jgi:TolA-binding protein
MLHGLVKYEGLQQQLSNLNDRLSDLNNIISEIVNKQNKVQYIRTDNTYEY